MPASGSKKSWGSMKRGLRDYGFSQESLPVFLQPAWSKCGAMTCNILQPFCLKAIGNTLSHRPSTSRFSTRKWIFLAMKLLLLSALAVAMAQDFEEEDLLAAVEAEDCFSQDCDAAGLHLAQLRATYQREQAQQAPKYQYFGSDELDFEAAIEEDADAGIAFVQTSAQLISAGSNAMSVDATGAVMAAHHGSSPAAALANSQVMSVSADGRMHVEM
eukprot:s1861_g10.t1